MAEDQTKMVTLGEPTTREATISEIIDYPLDDNGDIVARRVRVPSPKQGAPSPSQAGSVDWLMVQAFGCKEEAVKRIESMIVGLGEGVDKMWLRFIVTYRQWEIMHRRGEMVETPTLNLVCHTLGIDTSTFLKAVRAEIQPHMAEVGKIKAAIRIPQVVDKIAEKAESEEADVKERELFLRIAGVIDERGGINVQINNTNQNAVVLKGDRDKQRTPLLQFSETVENIDNEVRNGYGSDIQVEDE